MGLPKFTPSHVPVIGSPPTRQKRIIPEGCLTTIFENDITARAAGLGLSKTELGERGDILLNRLDSTLGYENTQWLADLLQEWKNIVTAALIRILNARWFVVLAQCLSHLLQNAGDNKVYLVKKHHSDDSECRSFDTLYVGVGA